MNIKRKVACAAMALGVCSAAMAEPMTATEPSPAWAALAEPTGEGIQAASAASFPWDSGSGIKTAAAATVVFPTSIDTTLWYYVRHVKAQQSGRALPLVETSLKLLETNVAAVAAVPLPGSAWFLVMGLLGAAAVRLQRTGTRDPVLAPATAST